MLLLELVRSQVVQGAVWSHSVLVPSPGFDDDSGLSARPEPLQRETFVAELSVEPLIGSVLLWFARIVERGCNAGLGDPLQDRMTDEFRSIV